jgi:hypothetical protein
MIEIALQLKGKALHPYSAEDLEKLKEYRENQVLMAKVSGTRKQRSLQQLRLYWAVCGLVAENTEDPQWNTKAKVDFNCRVATHFVDPNLVSVKKDGTVVFSYRSIAFANLKHIEACRYFDRAFDLMAVKTRTSIEDLMAEGRKQ